VERPPERHHRGPAGDLAGQLERPVHGLGPRVAEEDLRLVEERAQLPDALGQLDVAGVVDHHGRVHQGPGLGGDGLDHPGVAVAGRVHGDAGAQVEEATPLDVDQPRPLPPLGDHVVVAGQDPGERLVVAGQPGGGGAAVGHGGHRPASATSGCVSICAFCSRPE
jgi:hypothetical protein